MVFNEVTTSLSGTRTCSNYKHGVFKESLKKEVEDSTGWNKKIDCFVPIKSQSLISYPSWFLPKITHFQRLDMALGMKESTYLSIKSLTTSSNKNEEVERYP